MRVVQGGNRASLALEPLLQIRVTGDMLGQHLDGDGAVEARVSSFVDLAHAPGTERGVDLIGAERGARGQGHPIDSTCSPGFRFRLFLESDVHRFESTSRICRQAVPEEWHQQAPTLLALNEARATFSQR